MLTVEPIDTRRIRIIEKIIRNVGIALPVGGLGGFYQNVLPLHKRFRRIEILYWRTSCKGCCFLDRHSRI